jgi:hypothetical protein
MPNQMEGRFAPFFILRGKFIISALNIPFTASDV